MLNLLIALIDIKEGWSFADMSRACLPSCLKHTWIYTFSCTYMCNIQTPNPVRAMKFSGQRSWMLYIQCCAQQYDDTHMNTNRFRLSPRKSLYCAAIFKEKNKGEKNIELQKVHSVNKRVFRFTSSLSVTFYPLLCGSGCIYVCNERVRESSKQMHIEGFSI